MSVPEGGGSIDRNKAIGYLIAKAMAAQVFGDRERYMAFTEAAQIIKAMPPAQKGKDLNGSPYRSR